MSHNPQRKTCARVYFLIELQAPGNIVRNISFKAMEVLVFSNIFKMGLSDCYHIIYNILKTKFENFRSKTNNLPII